MSENLIWIIAIPLFAVAIWLEIDLYRDAKERLKEEQKC